MNVNELLEPITTRSLWIRIVGILLIIYAVLQALTIFGLIIAWLPFWLGLLLIRAADASNNLAESEDSDYAYELAEQLGKFFKITGIAWIVILTIAFVMILVTLFVVAAAAASGF